MRIVIDIQSVIGQKTGVGKYTEGLVKGLSRLPDSHRFILFYFNFHSRFKGLELSVKNFTNKGVKLPGRLFSFLWKKGCSFKFDRLSGEADLFHFPNFISRPVKSGKTVVTIHDLAFRRFPQYIEKKNLAFLNDNLPGTLARADKIIAVSRFTKDELLKFFPVPEKKIKVIHEGIDRSFRQINDHLQLAKVREKYKLPEKFLLWVGTLEPRKNIFGLLEAFAIFKARDKTNCKLVMAGKRGWNYQGFFEKAQNLSLSDDVLLTEYVADEDLPFIYNLAEVFIFPSFYEGFGLPSLEAMACGLPVITTPALGEVVEEAALIVSPYEASEMARGMAEVLENTDLKASLIQKGLKQIEKFSWSKAASQTLSLYEETIRGK